MYKAFTLSLILACLVCFSTLAVASHYVVVEDGLTAVAHYKDCYVVDANVGCGIKAVGNRPLKVGDVINVVDLGEDKCSYKWDKFKVVCVQCAGKLKLAFLEPVVVAPPAG